MAFLDEALEQIYDDGIKNGNSVNEIAKKVLDECFSRLPDEEVKYEYQLREFLNKLRQVEYSYRMFAERHKGVFVVDGFRRLYLKNVRMSERTRRYLKW